MNILLHGLFSAVAIAVFAYFFLSFYRRWLAMHRVAQGAEEYRQDHFFSRLGNALLRDFFQLRMFAEPGAAIMHCMIFWGFVTICLGTLETLLEGSTGLSALAILGDGLALRTYLLSQDIANFGVFAAIIYAIFRRLVIKPERLRDLSSSAQLDALIVLGLILALVTTGLINFGLRSQGTIYAEYAGILVFSRLFALPFTEIAGAASGSIFSHVIWLVHVGALFGFMIYLPHSKHQHLVWVWFNSFFRSRKSSGRIRPMAFDEDAESFGVGSVSGFTWKQLLDTQTCVECGRCSAQCPAHNTGKELDPRNMIHHIKDSFFEHLTPEAEEPKRRTLIGGIVSHDELWACTTCGACMTACPLDIEHIPAIIDMRRYLTMTEGDIPHELQTSLHNVEMNANPWGFDNNDRAAWTKGLGIKTMNEVDGDVEYLFWVGCAGSFDERYQKVSRAIAKVLEHTGISFAILGNEEQCNGDVARRAGNEYLADAQIRGNIETMQRYKVQKIITGCPHCFNTLKNEYPDFGFSPTVIHHSEFLSELASSGVLKLQPQQLVGEVTYHDSCYLGRHNQIFDGPRQLISQATGSQPIEMPRNRQQGFCCGAGGARMWMDEHEGEKINVERTQEAIASGASTVATACPFCLTMIDDGRKSLNNENLSVLDIAEIVSTSLPATD